MTKEKKPETLADEMQRANENALQKVVDAATRSAKRGGIRFSFMDEEIAPSESGKIAIAKSSEPHPLAGTILAKSAVTEENLAKSAVTFTDDIKRGGTIQRLAFDEEPTQFNYFQSLWKPKRGLLPDYVLKQVAYRDSLVAAILGMRSNMVSSFGRELHDRFATGYRIEPRPGVMEDATDEQKEVLQQRISMASKSLGTCGSTKGVEVDDRMSFSTFLGLQTRNGLTFGKFATEISYTVDTAGKREFHSFRPTDAGTIYMAAPRHDSVAQVRKQALALLEKLNGPDKAKLKPEKFENDEYTWVQVIDGRPRQAFTSDEMVVHNLYPMTDIEFRGYPLSPIETCIDSISTHMNITQYNKLYFQSGRAARGMVVIQSADVDQSMVAQIRQHFNASINSVSNAHRVPIFGVDPEEDLKWVPMDAQGGRDMEFQYLSDNNAREILSAFYMSPEELAGYAHLSKGTNSQALSECLQPLTRVTTHDGLVTLGSILGDKQEAPLTLWDGLKWTEGRVFVSGPKHLVETVLSNGTSIQSSPDHKFMVLSEGKPTWAPQSELVNGDWVLVNKQPIKGFEANIPSFKGKKLTPEMFELLGWVTGDGIVVGPKPRAGGFIEFYYHHEYETAVWKKHCQMLEAFGLPCKNKEIYITQEEADAICLKRGFNTLSTKRIVNIVYDTDFVRFLLDWGFATSHDSKIIPDKIHGLPEEYRAAFLRGLFSADGGKLNETGSLCLTVHNDNIRDGTRQLLLGLGIRCLGCKGVWRDGFGEGKTFSPKLYIKDRQTYWDKIGFCQDFKFRPEAVEQWQHDSIPEAVMYDLAKVCMKSDGYKKLPKTRKDRIRQLSQGRGRCTLTYLESSFEACGIELPKFLQDYHIERVDELIDHNEIIEMLDVEMFSDDHSFIAEGIVVHNSSGEYKLEAARDTGIRPLLNQFQDFVNEFLMPHIDPQVAKLCTFKLYGLDADTAEKESTRLQTDAPIHMTMDEILERTEKDPVGKKWGGQFLMNPAWQAILDKYFTVGEVAEYFFDRKGASQDPTLAYIPHPFWFNWQQLQMQQKQMEQQAQQAAQQPPPGQAEGGAPPEGQDQPPEGQQSLNDNRPPASELTEGADQVLDMMKSEKNLSPNKRRLLELHKMVVKESMDKWEDESKKAIAEILDIVKKK